MITYKFHYTRIYTTLSLTFVCFVQLCSDIPRNAPMKSLYAILSSAAYIRNHMHYYESVLVPEDSRYEYFYNLFIGFSEMKNRYWLWVFNTTVDEITGKRCYAENEVINMLEFYINKTFFKLGGHIFKQIISISMETNCVPLFINLFLYSYEAEFMQKLIKDIIFSFFVGFSKCQLHAVFSCHVELNLLKYHLYYETMHIKCVFLHISTIPVINPYNRPSV